MLDPGGEVWEVIALAWRATATPARSRYRGTPVTRTILNDSTVDRLRDKVADALRTLHDRGRDGLAGWADRGEGH